MVLVFVIVFVEMVVDIVIIILNRECAEIVRDFATFHIFFDFYHIPDQVDQRRIFIGPMCTWSRSLGRLSVRLPF